MCQLSSTNHCAQDCQLVIVVSDVSGGCSRSTRVYRVERDLLKFSLELENEIMQLANEYELRIRKKGYILQDIWEKCEQVSDEALESWYEKGFQEEGKRQCSIDGTHYDPLKLSMDTYKVKL
ncbi:hypothetical protein Tco_0902799 [Tanacetum coccineum]